MNTLLIIYLVFLVLITISFIYFLIRNRWVCKIGLIWIDLVYLLKLQSINDRDLDRVFKYDMNPDSVFGSYDRKLFKKFWIWNPRKLAIDKETYDNLLKEFGFSEYPKEKIYK